MGGKKKEKKEELNVHWHASSCMNLPYTKKKIILGGIQTLQTLHYFTAIQCNLPQRSVFNTENSLPCTALSHPFHYANCPTELNFENVPLHFFLPSSCFSGMWQGVVGGRGWVRVTESVSLQAKLLSSIKNLVSSQPL